MTVSEAVFASQKKALTITRFGGIIVMLPINLYNRK